MKEDYLSHVQKAVGKIDEFLGAKAEQHHDFKRIVSDDNHILSAFSPVTCKEKSLQSGPNTREVSGMGEGFPQGQ